MDDIDEKVTRLPAWAREYIRSLKRAAEPNNDDLRAARRAKEEAEKRLRRIEAQCDAMMDIFKAAGRGGNETAAAYVARVVDSYSSEQE